MRIKLEFRDRDSYVSQEAVHNLKAKYGVDCEVQVLPDADTPESYLRFAIRELISTEQLEYFFEYNEKGYANKMQDLKTKIVAKVEEVFDEIVKDNEKRIE